MARAAFVATPAERRMVKAMASFGINQEAIVCCILRPAGKTGEAKPISTDTLQRHFRSELDSGLPDFLFRVAKGLGQTALDRKHPSHAAASMFIMKCRGGWSEKAGQLAPSADGVNMAGMLDLSTATREEIAVVRKFMRNLTAANDRAA